MHKVLAVAFLSTFTAFAFSGGQAAADAPMDVGDARALASQLDVADAADGAEALKSYTNANDCAAACKAAGCTSSQFIAPKSCTCSGCFH